MSEFGELPQLNKEDVSVLSRNLELTDSLPVVKNGFISKEQAAYCLGWKDIVNPDSQSQVVLYNAMGPDVGTVLLTTNATDVYGVDFQPPSIDKTSNYLEAWDIVDSDAVSLPPEDDSYIEKYHKEGILTPATVTAAMELGKTLQLRAERGYWDVGEMDTWSIDRCLMIELKKLGIKREDLKVTESNGQVQLAFPWAFPGEDPKPRRITYIEGMTYDIINNPSQYNLPTLDGFYEKSVEAGRWAGMNNNDLHGIQQFIKPGGYALIGRGHGSSSEEEQLEVSNRRALGINFTPLHIAGDYKDMMHAKLTGEHASKYGWDLYGARKIVA